MSEAQQYYDAYKGSILLLVLVALTTLTPLLLDWKWGIACGLFGLTAIVFVYKWLLRKPYNANNDLVAKKAIQSKFRPSKKFQYLILLILIPLVLVGSFKHEFNILQSFSFVIFSASFSLTITSLLYLPFWCKKHIRESNFI